jgi:N-acetylglucosaminyldiphosphoundecaprenol N-acetyl-beta-D-mannosaminyltransferase
VLAPKSVTLSKIRVANVDAEAIFADIRDVARQGRSEPAKYFALHVGGLTAARESDSFCDAMNSARMVYADGISVVILARMLGANRIQRCATTDIGLSMITAAGKSLGRPVRLALVGGPAGLAERASRAIADEVNCNIVFASHGFHDDWRLVAKRLDELDVDVLLIGVGMPHEAFLACDELASVSARIVLTCGGWFGFLVGDEKRAPRGLSKSGFEWVWRLKQSPRRLIGRYARGGLSFMVSAAEILWSRLLLRVNAYSSYSR